MRVVTADEMREIDRRTTSDCGVPSLTLMENAAIRLREYVEHSRLVQGGRLVVLCGKGNNGGDGLAFARLWREGGGEAPLVLLFGKADVLQGDAATNYRRLRDCGVEVLSVASESEWEKVCPSIERAHLVVDAILGTGVRGRAEGLLARVISEVNERGASARVLAVDTPSGLPSDGPLVEGPVLRADHTVTFTAPKVGLLNDRNQEWVGNLKVARIGSPDELIDRVAQSQWRWLEAGEFRRLTLHRKHDAHKGDFGHALIAAGARGKSGAAALAGLGALWVGAGLVTIATAEDSLPVVASFAREYMTQPLQETEAGTISPRSLEYGKFEALLAGKTVLALGPGVSTHTETQEFVRAVVARCPLPVILDADGLNAFAGCADKLKQRAAPCLAVTPHPGEMARLVGRSVQEIQSNRIATALECAARWNAYVVLKGYRTLVATPSGELFFNSTGTPAMASGGTGDVLTGILAGLSAQFGTEDWGRVLGLGAWLHGKAGEFVVAGGRTTLLASQLAEAVAEARAGLETELLDEASNALC